MPNEFKTELAPIVPWDKGAPKVNGPAVYGASPDKAFLYYVPATGERPIEFSAERLPAGLSINAEDGTISGVIVDKGRYQVLLRVKNQHGQDAKQFEIIAEGMLALTPPLGWNSWNAFRESVSDDKIRMMADNMVSSGLAARGYTYVNVDSCWQSSERGGEYSAIKPNNKFPDMKALSSYVHAKGLKFGIYSTPWNIAWGGDDLIGCSSGELDPMSTPLICDDDEGNPQLAPFPGKYIGLEKHEKNDVKQFMDWNIDYLKYDWAPTDPISARRMSDELKQAPRDVVMSVCTEARLGWGKIWKTTVNMFRDMADTHGTWESIYDNAVTRDHQQSNKYHGPGCWWDLDMLVLGPMMTTGQFEEVNELTRDEQIMHMTMWSLRPSPLLVSCDLSCIDELSLTLLSNEEVLAVNQDALGKPAERIIHRATKSRPRLEEMVSAKSLADGSIAVGVFNLAGKARQITFKLEDIGLAGTVLVRDLWARRDLGSFNGEFSIGVPEHGAQLLLLFYQKNYCL